VRGNLPIREAIDQHHYQIVRLLVEAKSKVNQKGSFDDVAPLSWVIRNNDSDDTIQLLLEHGAQVEAHTLVSAIQQKKGDLLKLLLIYQKLEINEFVVMAAVKAQKLSILEIVLSKSTPNTTHLLEAARMGNIEIVKCLLDAKASAEMQNGVTPLGEAGRSRHYDIVRLLLPSSRELCDSQHVISAFLNAAIPPQVVDIIIQYFGTFTCSKCTVPATKAYKAVCHPGNWTPERLSCKYDVWGNPIDRSPGPMQWSCCKSYNKKALGCKKWPHNFVIAYPA